jgi:hypothetical protein
VTRELKQGFRGQDQPRHERFSILTLVKGFEYDGGHHPIGSGFCGGDKAL